MDSQQIFYPAPPAVNPVSDFPAQTGDIQVPIYPAPNAPALPADRYNGMPPPPQKDYASLTELTRAVQEHAGANGYACVTASNNLERGIAYLRCDRGGKYVNHWGLTEETRVRKNRTRRLVDCKWRARAQMTKQGVWRLSMITDVHNGHSATHDASTHPSLRQLPAEATDEIQEAFAAGQKAKQVLEVMKSRWNPRVTIQDIYNIKAKIARKAKGTGNNGLGGQVSNSEKSEDPQLPMDPVLLAEDQQRNLQQQQVPAVASTAEEIPGPVTQVCTCQCCKH